MKTHSFESVCCNLGRIDELPAACLPRAITLAGIGLALLVGMTGCQMPQYKNPTVEQINPPEAITLREGDVVRISFPGAADLDTTQQIRRDGRIALPMLGEFKAAGLTPGAMEKELIKLYGSQLQTKSVNVSIASSSFPIYVTGAVLRPGKIMADRPLGLLEAIMEAGGFDYSKANLKAVSVIRHENEREEHYTFDLKRVLRGEQSKPFNLKPSDIIYVPERFSWF